MNTTNQRRGAAAVIVRNQRWLVIRRAERVVAPGRYCFPGGGLEAAETEAQAVIRELREELQVDVQPIRRLWTSVTVSRVHLAWWHARLAPSVEPVPNPEEVASHHWMSLDELRSLPELLESNREFLAAWDRGEFDFDPAGEHNV